MLLNAFLWFCLSTDIGFIPEAASVAGCCVVYAVNASAV